MVTNKEFFEYVQDKFENQLPLMLKIAVLDGVKEHESKCAVASNWKNYKKLVDSLLSERDFKKNKVVLSYKQITFIIGAIGGIVTILVTLGLV